MSKKKKFDLTKLVHEGALKDGQILCFVSDPKKTCKIAKQPNHEFKVLVGPAFKETTTVHAFAQTCLGQEPPDHATKWLRTEDNAGAKTLWDLWHAHDEVADAA